MRQCYKACGLAFLDQFRPKTTHDNPLQCCQNLVSFKMARISQKWKFLNVLVSCLMAMIAWSPCHICLLFPSLYIYTQDQKHKPRIPDSKSWEKLSTFFKEP